MGTRLVDQAGTTMGEVVASIKRVTDLVGEIAEASDEQRAGIEQVNQSIAQMDQVTQQNAALVEEAAAAADAMQDQARELSGLVGTFQTGHEMRAQVVSAVAPRVTPGARAARLPNAAATPARAAVRKPAKVAEDEWETF